MQSFFLMLVEQRLGSTRRAEQFRSFTHALYATSASHGLDRLADTPVASISVGEGLSSAEASSVLASRDGSIWTGGDSALTGIRDDMVTWFRKGHDLPGSQVTSQFEDHAGRLRSASTRARGCPSAADSSRSLCETLVRSAWSQRSQRTLSSASGSRRPGRRESYARRGSKSA